MALTLAMALASKLKSLVVASNPTSLRKCLVLGSRTALFFLVAERKITKHKKFLNSGVIAAKIFDWGAQFVNNMQYDVIRNFQKKGLFMGQKHRRMEKIRRLEPELVRKQNVAKEGLEPKINVFKYVLNFIVEGR